METVNPLRFTHHSYSPYFNYWRAKEASAQSFSFELSPGRMPREEAGRDSFQLPQETAAGVLQLIPGKVSALLTEFVAAVSFLLHRYCDQQEIILHTPLQGGVESVIYENVVPLRIKVDERGSLADYLEDCRIAVKTAYRYQNFPLSLVRKKKSTYLESNIFLSLDGFHKPSKYHWLSGAYDLVLEVVCNKTDLMIHAEWNESCFPGWFIRNFIAHLTRFFSCFNQPAMAVADIRLLSDEEEERIQLFGTTISNNAPVLAIHRLFEEKVVGFSNRTAVLYKDITFTYDELNRKANKLAHFLQIVRGLMPGDYVGICLQRSPWQLISMLAIMKAGAVYVPVYMQAPENRRAFIFDDSGIKLLIAEEATREQPFSATQIVCLETDFIPLEENLPDHNPDTEVPPEDLAYVIYTSGTTGRPKGVMVKHYGVVNMAIDQVMKFGIRCTDHVIAFAAVSFDASVSEYLMTLYAGAALVVIEEEVMKHTRLLLDVMQQQQVTVATLPPAYLRILDPEQLRFLRVLITAGEPADPESASHCSRFLEYYNAYGPTENSVCTTIYQASPEDAGLKRLPIGRPVSGIQVYVLDNSLRLVPVGITGRLFISGVGLSPGYLHQPELSAEKFVQHWLYPGEKMYDSGDLAKWSPEGNLEFMGRNDDLIKIDGIRVEPEEVRVVLEQHPFVARCAVMAADLQGEKVLTAFVEPASGIGMDIEHTMREYLYTQLPAYMIPARMLIIDNIPVNSSGKIDKLELIPLLQENNAYMPPLNEKERHIQGIWQKVLNITFISMDGHFFRLGATSINVISLNSLMKQEYPDFDIRTVFNHPVLRDFVNEVSGTKNALL
ncbi:MAG TPA: non-ribosomal peptide synthetase [Chitinophaga sp.]|uniref:non-ribosomal peptide synthetase n=1 Tax=Chitinophaga sp. TaxID=1869181 RepID=UPI002C481E8B|nr:non-ribosomal peptide synthetase [Chitinophaga sp.]HVI47932.1 non-ribosomal peptide synthetase [Chitinophaga sp.]